MTFRSISEISRRQTIKDNNADFVASEAMLAELREDNLGRVRTLRDVKAAADDARDNVTSAVIDEWTDQAEQRALFSYSAL